VNGIARGDDKCRSVVKLVASKQSPSSGLGINRELDLARDDMTGATVASDVKGVLTPRIAEHGGEK
jgi:hypothetical protein